jgi:hypothetical protein
VVLGRGTSGTGGRAGGAGRHRWKWGAHKGNWGRAQVVADPSSLLPPILALWAGRKHTHASCTWEVQFACH